MNFFFFFFNPYLFRWAILKSNWYVLFLKEKLGYLYILYYIIGVVLLLNNIVGACILSPINPSIYSF